MKTKTQTWFVVQTSRYHYMTECGDGLTPGMYGAERVEDATRYTVAEAKRKASALRERMSGAGRCAMRFPRVVKVTLNTTVM